MQDYWKTADIIAGTMTWGVWGKGYSTNVMAGLIESCLDMGITVFDHADIYGGYTTEADFGKALTASGVSRDRFSLISKCGIQYACEARPNIIKHYQYDTEYIIASAEASLRNLETEYLDLLLLHRPSPLMHPEEVAAAFDKLRSSGKVRAFGVSNFTPSQIALIESGSPLEAHQFECSLTARDALYDGTLDDCLLHSRTAMAWSPLGSYFREESETTVRIREVLDPLCAKYEATADQLLLAWLLRHPARIRPVVGTTREDRIAMALEAAKITLEREEWFSLLVAAQGHKVP